MSVFNLNIGFLAYAVNSIDSKRARSLCEYEKNMLDRTCHPNEKVCHQTILPKRGNSVLALARNVATQMSCNINGAPWNVPIPDLLTIGFDVRRTSHILSTFFVIHP